MWSDGYFNPHAWDKYGFDEYQLKHCCFGGDGDEQGEATGGDPGDADDYYEDDTPVTPDDFSGLQEAYEDTVVGGNKGFGRSGPMSPEEVMDAMGQAQATSVATNPYTDMITHGYIADPNQPDSPGLTPSEMGFVPQYGYDVYGSENGIVSKLGDRRFSPFDPLPEDVTLTPYDPSVISREELGKSYTDAYEGSRDLGSGLASLFGFQSPVEFDSKKGFYEGTTFDPFDAPVLSLLASMNPLTGALYGLTKGVVKGDPVGGALSMLGPYSSLRPAVDAARNVVGASNVWTGNKTTLADLLGLSTTPVSNKYGTGAAKYSFMGDRIDPTIDIDYTSVAPIYNPANTLAGWKDQVVGYTKDLFSDPTAGKATYDPNALPSTPALNPQQLEGLGLGAQQAVKDAMLDIGREERANAILGNY